MNTPDSLVKAVIQATKNAENLKQGPVFVLDVQKAFVKINQGNSSALDIKNVLYDLHRNDKILADEEMNRFSFD